MSTGLKISSILWVIVTMAVLTNLSFAQPIEPITEKTILNVSYPTGGNKKLNFHGKSEPACSGELGEPGSKCAESPGYGIFGDLNGDKIADAAVIQNFMTGGSGVAVTLYAVIATPKGPLVLGPELIGDRVQIEKMEIESEKIVMHLTAHGPNDPSCCPTQKKTLAFTVKNGKLTKVKG